MLLYHILAALARKFYHGFLQCFGHFQSKNKGAKSMVGSIYFLIEMCDQFLQCRMALMALKRLRLFLIEKVKFLALNIQEPWMSCSFSHKKEAS